MAAKLTALTVENAKPRNKAGKPVRTELSDRGCPGLFLIVQPSRVKSWALRYRVNGKSRKLTLGPAATEATSGLSLAAARAAAAQAQVEIELGTDPAAEKARARAVTKAALREAETNTIEALVEQFLRLHAKPKTRPTSYANTRGILTRVAAKWKGRTIHDIKRRDVIDLVEDIAVKHPVMANRMLAALSKFFRWAQARDLIAVSPCTGVERCVEKPRERVLDDNEIAALWRACADEPVFGPFIKVLMLTGCRRAEAAKMTFSEIVERQWKLPAARTKNKKSHVIPLSPLAFNIIMGMPRIGPYVFTIDSRRPIAGFHHIKTRLDAKLKFTEPFTLHDIRRSVASGLQRLKVPVEVIEKALNHVSGTYRGIIGTYQRDQLLDERTQALEAWGAHIEQLVGGEPAPQDLKVVPLHGKRR